MARMLVSGFAVITLLGMSIVVADPAAANGPSGTDRRGQPDFNGDGFADLAVGAPLEDGAATDAGAVNVLYGSARGLTATGNQPPGARTARASGSGSSIPVPLRRGLRTFADLAVGPGRTGRTSAATTSPATGLVAVGVSVGIQDLFGRGRRRLRRRRLRHQGCRRGLPRHAGRRRPRDPRFGEGRPATSSGPRTARASATRPIHSTDSAMLSRRATSMATASSTSPRRRHARICHPTRSCAMRAASACSTGRRTASAPRATSGGARTARASWARRRGDLFRRWDRRLRRWGR